MATAHDGLIEAVERLRPDIAAPTRLPGWRVGHVLTHVEHNAVGYRSVLTGGAQYESYDARDRAIGAAATRPLTAICAAMRRANAELVAAFDAETGWGRSVEMLVRRTQPGLMTLARRREIEVHHLDLELGREPAAIDEGYIARDTAMLTAWWEAKHRSPLPPSIASQPPLARWLWLVGRSDATDLEPAGLL